MNENGLSEQRQYIRLKSGFPVKFTIVHLQEGIPGIGWQQGYTMNVSKGGIGLETTALNEATIKYLNREDVYLEAHIYVPLARTSIKAVCEVAWFKKQEINGQNAYFVGLKFRSIADTDLKKILHHAGWVRFIPNFLRRKKYEKSS